MIKILDRIGKKLIDRRCTVDKHKLVAIAFTDSGHIIATETNKKSTLSASGYSTVHAEEGLIRKLLKISAKERFGGINVLVGRWGRKNGWTLSFPCRNCAVLMQKYPVKKVFYTDSNGRICESK